MRLKLTAVALLAAVPAFAQMPPSQPSPAQTVPPTQMPPEKVEPDNAGPGHVARPDGSPSEAQVPGQLGQPLTPGQPMSPTQPAPGQMGIEPAPTAPAGSPR
ncbi:MAG TPA: hypothetical protein VGB82_29185 [Alphaproteobacteria bacterium]